jgi:glycosyltransferase involved in cell wall biosynthesis
MTISIVIATYNRAPLLETCLRSLLLQEFEPGDEIVVADNGSTDATPAVITRAAARARVPLRAVRELRPGKSHALACALAGCRADVLAFTDDDVIVDRRWLASIRRGMAQQDVDLIGGKVLPSFSARVPDWLDLRSGTRFGVMSAPLALLDYGRAVEPLGPRTALGANLAIRRAVFEEAGGFDGRLGKLRGTLLSGEDHQLCERVQAAGHRAIYDPAVVVRHHVPADRLRLRYFLRWFFWSGVTHARLHAGVRAEGPTFLGAPRYLFRRLAVSTAASTGAVLTGGWASAAEHATRAMFAAGYLWTTWSSAWRRPAGGGGAPVEAA